MSIILLAQVIHTLATIFIWIVIASSLLSFFVSPYHPVRQTLDRIIAPFLDPIRRRIPLMGTVDISPMILILLIWLAEQVLIILLDTMI